MKYEEKFSPRSRLLLFQTLELIRKEIQPQFSDWKDADDWLFAQLDFTKDELAQIYKGRDVLYYDGSAVDYKSATDKYFNSLEFVADLYENIKILKVFSRCNELNEPTSDIFISWDDVNKFGGEGNFKSGYRVVNSQTLRTLEGCSEFCDTVFDAVKEFNTTLRTDLKHYYISEFQKVFESEIMMCEAHHMTVGFCDGWIDIEQLLDRRISFDEAKAVIDELKLQGIDAQRIDSKYPEDPERSLMIQNIENIITEFSLEKEEQLQKDGYHKSCAPLDEVIRGAEEVCASQKSWAEEKTEELSHKPRNEWTQEDWEAHNYIESVNAEADYLDSLDDR